MIKPPEIERLEQRFGQEVLDISIRSIKRATVTINADHLVAFCQFLYRELHVRFIIASALDTSRGIEILYHFSGDRTGLILNLLVILDKNKPEIESLTGLFEAANWIEREMHEIMGIYFRNHPNLEKLISEGNWAEGVYPYRKSEQ
jgi:NADH-quinone oxidoreductase subunit C